MSFVVSGRMRRTVATTATILLILCAGGCVVGPDFHAPCPPPLHGQFEGPIANDHHSDLACWWSEFNDPILNGLVAQAITQNPDLREASFRIAEARSRRGVVAGDLLPQINGPGSFTYKQTSQNANQFVSSFGGPFHLYSSGLDASWELDLFGKIARSIEAADAEIFAEMDARNAIMVSMLADVATNYTALRIAQTRLDIARQNYDGQRHTLQIVQQRFEAGLVSELDIAQARANLHTTAASMPALVQQRQEAVNRLSVLLGESPGGDLLKRIGSGSIPLVSAHLSVGAPAELLRRRPDIREAEQKVAIESARIGIAVAELYPQFSLAGNVSADSRSFTQWFVGNSLAYGLGPSIRWNILNFGRVSFAIDAQKERHQQAVIQYQSTVLRAVEEVENALSALATEQDRVASLIQAVLASRDAVRLSRAKYEQGLIAFQTVLDSERALLDNESQLAASRGRVVLQLVRAYKALGGGWCGASQPMPPAEPLPPTSPEPVMPPLESLPVTNGHLPRHDSPSPVTSGRKARQIATISSNAYIEPRR